jgi:hypoxanthine-guanine phosphoribosyltransferase
MVKESQTSYVSLLGATEIEEDSTQRLITCLALTVGALMLLGKISHNVDTDIDTDFQ